MPTPKQKNGDERGIYIIIRIILAEISRHLSYNHFDRKSYTQNNRYVSPLVKITPFSSLLKLCKFDRDGTVIISKRGATIISVFWIVGIREYILIRLPDVDYHNRQEVLDWYGNKPVTIRPAMKRTNFCDLSDAGRSYYLLHLPAFTTLQDFLSALVNRSTFLDILLPYMILHSYACKIFSIASNHHLRGRFRGYPSGIESSTSLIAIPLITSHCMA